MIRQLLDALLGRPEGTPSGLRLVAERRPEVLYAIGDIHGCLDPLLALESKIYEDARGVAGEKWLIYLGDYVDRGPKSAQVLDHLMEPPPEGFRRICLRGNHETVMLSALEDIESLENWLAFGGDATLLSYGMPADKIDGLLSGGRPAARLQLVKAYVPEEHIRFLEELALLVSVPGFVFVHAGLRPRVPLADQVERDLIWIRDEFLDVAHDHGAVVVHGHTPSPEVEMLDYRIGIDTACYLYGRLTALRIDAAGNVSVLQNMDG